MLFALPVFAGEYENALKKSDSVFLYLYSSDCRTCKAFDKIYYDMAKQNNDFEFVRINADTPYGARLIRKFKGKFVPYIILTNSKTNRSVNVIHSCVMDEMCLIRALKSFKG